MKLDLQAAEQSIAAYEAYNKKAITAVANSNNENELNQNLQEVGAFDFQNGQSYSRALTNLALGDMMKSDANGDMEIDLQEFIKRGIELYSGIFDQDTLAEMANSDDIVEEFYSMDYGSNNGLFDFDDKVSLDELMLFYSLADESLPGETVQRIKDGKFTQEDLAQAQNLFLDLIMKENPEIEDQLMARLSEVYKHLNMYSILTDYDYNNDSQIEESEFVTLKSTNVEEEQKPEAKADAYAMFHLVDLAMGNNDGVISEDEIAAFVDYANDKGVTIEEYYDYLLQNNFKNEDAGNHAYYADILAQFQALANK